MPLHVLYQIWGHFSPTMVWNGPSNKSFHRDTFSPSFHLILAGLFRAPLQDMSLESTNTNILELLSLTKLLNSTYIECHVELIFQEIVDVPTLSEPLCSLLIGLQSEPVHISCLVILHILKLGRKHRWNLFWIWTRKTITNLDQGLVLFLQPLHPQLLLPGTGTSLEQGNTAKCLLCTNVNHNYDD